MLGKNANTSSNLWVDFYYNGVARGSVTSVTSPSGLTISGNNTSGTKGQGTLNLKASTIRAKISDSSITDITFLPNVGTYNPGNTEGEISVATGTYTTVGSISLDPGTWFLTFGCYFSNNGTGYRRLYLGTGSNNSSNIGIQTKVEVPGQTNVSPNYLHGSYPIEVTGTQTVTYYLKAYQNSGSALTAQGRVYGIRIK